MIAHRKKQSFRLRYAGNLDFRRGYKRCVEPGAETYIPPITGGLGLRSTRLQAEFWRNRTGGLFVRFNSSHGYIFCYEALLLNGEPVPDKDLDKFIDFIMEVLLDWGGTDDPPDENFISEPDACFASETRRIGRKKGRT